MAEQWCDIWTGSICSEPSPSLPFWEIASGIAVSALATAVTICLTAVVTWITIWAATKSAREATNASLAHASQLHVDSLAAAERQARYQQRIRESQVLREAVRTYAAAVRRGDNPAAIDRVQDTLRTADAVFEPSLTPGAPQLLRVVTFALELMPLKDEIEDEWDWTNDVLEREEEVLDRISRWTKDPEAAMVKLVEEANRIATLSVFETVMGPMSKDLNEEVLRPGQD